MCLKKQINLILMIVIVTLFSIACADKKGYEEANLDNDKNLQNEKTEEPKKTKNPYEILEQVKPLEENELIVNNEQASYTSFAVFGIGNLGPTVSTTGLNAIMIISIDNQTKEVKVASIYKDTLLQQTDGEFRKATSLYSRNISEMLSGLNINLDLTIKNYMTIDFFALAEIIDSLNGIEITLTEQEAKEMNRYIDELSKVLGKTGIQVESGEQNLNGLQTIAYSYIRKNVGGDYARTERQQVVVKCIIEKMKERDLSDIIHLIDIMIPKMSTNYKTAELLSMCSDVQKYNINEGIGFPIEKTSMTLSGNGSVVISTNLGDDVESLHRFLYPTETYDISEKIAEIETDIKQVIESK